MNPPPRAPTIRRPAARGNFTPPPRPVRRSRGSGSLLGSLGLHAIAFATACAIGVTATGGGRGGGEPAGGGSPEPFRMSAPSRGISGKITAAPALPVRKPPPIRIAAADLPGPQLPWPSPGQTMEIFPASSGAAAWSGGASGNPPANGPPSKGGSGGAGKRGDRGNRSGPAAAARLSPPHPVSSPPPRYPREAKARGASGTVSILVRVRRDGSAASAEIYRSSGSGPLDQAAAAAVRRWKFSATPALAEGETIAVVVRVNFSL